MKTISVLFVCMGNICRSPTAHGIFQQLVDSNGLSDQILVDSAGTLAYHEGEAPDHRACQTARKHGIDLSALRARRVNANDYASQDYILAMDADNLRNMQLQCPEAYAVKLSLLLDFHPSPNLFEVPDPYYGGASGFESVYKMVDEACQALFAHIRANDLK